MGISDEDTIYETKNANMCGMASGENWTRDTPTRWAVHEGEVSFWGYLWGYLMKCDPTED